MDIIALLFALLRHAACGEKLTDETINACTAQNLEQVYTLAKKHDLAHLVAHAVEGLDLLPCELLDMLKKEKVTAIYRYTRLDLEFARICSILEQAVIPFLPLKGSVLRPLYPEGWMRSSCDIDVLVRPETLQDAVTHLEKAGYRRKGKGHHDVSLYSPSGVHLELHYRLTDQADPEPVRKALDTVWENAERKQGTSNHHLMTDGYFYLYHMAHMANHFLRGGCGIRACLDIWVMNHLVTRNTAERETLLAQCGLLAFANAAEMLADYWFSGRTPDPQTLHFAECVLNGGIYGAKDNGAALQKAADTKLRIPFRRILIPMEDLRYSYPILDKKPWLMPLCQVLRWLRLGGILCGVLKKHAAAQKISQDTERKTRQLLQYLQL